MKICYLSSALLLMSLSLFAQKDKDIPAFGKVDKAELEMTSCDFDKNAEAVALIDVGELASIDFSPLQFEHRVRIKILNNKGLDHANIHLRYIGYHNDEKITGLSAQTYNLDANGNVVVTKVDKKQIFDKRIDKYYSEVVFSFPEVKAGSIIEYKYTHYNVSLLDWYFQRSIPVVYSRFVMDYPSEIEISSTPYVSLPLEKNMEDKGTRTVQRFVMHNIPALRDEPYISCDDDYRERVLTRVISVNVNGIRKSFTYNWPAVVKDLMEDEDFGVQLKKNIPRTSDLDEALKNINDPYQKMKTIFEYVRKNMEWNGQHGIYAYDGVKSAWKEKKGSNAEINLILVNLLKDAGLDASPLLVSTRENGQVNTLIPNIGDFNAVVAYVKIGDDFYVLDATDKYTPPRLIPENLMYSEGLAIEKYDTYEWGWRTIWNPKEQYKSVSVFTMNIDDEGKLKGSGRVSSYDYARLKRYPTLKLGKDKFEKAYFSDPNPDYSIDSFHLANEDNDSLPLVQDLQFHRDLPGTGDYRYFTLNMFTGMEKNPFLADHRFSDIFFGYDQDHEIMALVNIPDGYSFEALPHSIRMMMPDSSIQITRRVASNEHQLSVRISLEFKQPFFYQRDYAYFKEFYKKLFDLLSEQYVIKKKANP